ncbi:MAG: hemolysin family protein [Rhodothermia bacterium]|nr:hemolysin family protein [Rhodothermia bacterium]
MDPDSASLTLTNLIQSYPGPSLDPTTLAVEFGIFLLLLLSSAIFSGSEVALFSLDWSSREKLAEAEDRASARVLKLLEQPREVLISILILNTAVNVAAAIIAAVVTKQVADFFDWNPVLTVLGEVIVLAFVILVVAEITPKLLARRSSVRFARLVSGFLLALHRVLYPASKSIAAVTKTMHGRFTPARRLSGEDVKAMAEIGEAHGTLEEDERELIHSIVEFGETTVREVMVSRLDIVALEVSLRLEEALDVIRESGHSRMPLYVEHLDNILGIIHAKDLLPYLSTNGRPHQEVNWTDISRKALFVPAGKKLDDLLKEFQARSTHIAIVVDEYGGTAGLVTLEDILEEIVGDIRDEYDDSEQPLYEQIAEGTYRFDARIDLDELNEVLEIQLDTAAFDFETLGGLILDLSGTIPSSGDELRYHRLRIVVHEVDNRRIKLADVTVLDEDEIAAADPSE